MRVPPDQSSICLPTAPIASSISRSRSSRVTRVRRVPKTNASTSRRPFEIVNLPRRLKPRGLRLTTARVGRGHARLVAQPTGRGSAPTGTVLGRDIASGVQVSIEMIPTLPTLEYALRTAVVASRMPTAATQLRGMSRVNRNHRTTPFLGLVRDFRLETGERPAMHPALRFAAPFRFHTLANVFQVLQHDRAARRGSLHDLFA